jgi:hypothetical protein
MNFFKKWGQFMMMGAKAHAQWEIGVSTTIFRDKKRLLILGLLTIPIILGGIALADQISDPLFTARVYLSFPFSWVCVQV